MSDQAGWTGKSLGLEPIGDRRTLSSEVAERLRDLILLGRLGPGDPVRERDLAEALGISRTPLREALRVLEHEGLVVYSPTRRPFVADPDMETLRQNMIVLGALEALAGEQACLNATDAEIARIAALSDEMSSDGGTDDPLAFFRRDMDFHALIAEASHNQPLAETQRRYTARLWRARFISSQRRPNRPGTVRQHADIAAALSRRDGPACAAALRLHLDTAIANVARARAEDGRDA